MTHSSESEIRELEAKIEQADVVTDPVLLDDLLIDGFMFTAQDGTIYTKERVLSAHRPAGVRKFKRFETSDLRIRAFDDAAVVTVRVDLETERVQLALLFTRFWARIGGRWRVIGGSAIELEHSHEASPR